MYTNWQGQYLQNSEERKFEPKIPVKAVIKHESKKEEKKKKKKTTPQL